MAKEKPTDEQVDTVLDAEVDLLSFSFGDCRAYVEQAHDAGAIIAQTVGNAVEARAAVDAGADVIVAQGWEAGGHAQSEVATMPLVPRVVDAVPDTPVLAAGGIADGRGIAAAFVSGIGGWIGTRFVASRESGFHQRYKQAILDGTETSTSTANLFRAGGRINPTASSAMIR